MAQMPAYDDDESPTEISDEALIDRLCLDEDDYAPPISDVRDAIDDVQQLAQDTHYPTDDNVVYEDDDVYVISGGDEGRDRSRMFDSAGVTHPDLRMGVRTWMSIVAHDVLGLDVKHPTVVDRNTDDATTETIISDDDIRQMTDEYDYPLAPTHNDVREDLEAVQEAAENNILYSPDDDDVVYEDDDVYIIQDDEREGLNRLLDDAGIDEHRQLISTLHVVAGMGIYEAAVWGVSWPLVIVKSDDEDVDEVVRPE